MAGEFDKVFDSLINTAGFLATEQAKNQHKLDKQQLLSYSLEMDANTQTLLASERERKGLSSDFADSFRDVQSHSNESFISNIENKKLQNELSNISQLKINETYLTNNAIYADKIRADQQNSFTNSLSALQTQAASTANYQEIMGKSEEYIRAYTEDPAEIANMKKTITTSFIKGNNLRGNYEASRQALTESGLYTGNEFDALWKATEHREESQQNTTKANLNSIINAHKKSIDIGQVLNNEEIDQLQILAQSEDKSIALNAQKALVAESISTIYSTASSADIQKRILETSNILEKNELTSFLLNRRKQLLTDPYTYSASQKIIDYSPVTDFSFDEISVRTKDYQVLSEVYGETPSFFSRQEAALLKESLKNMNSIDLIEFFDTTIKNMDTESMIGLLDGLKDIDPSLPQTIAMSYSAVTDDDKKQADVILQSYNKDLSKVKKNTSVSNNIESRFYSGHYGLALKAGSASQDLLDRANIVQKYYQFIGDKTKAKNIISLVSGGRSIHKYKNVYLLGEKKTLDNLKTYTKNITNVSEDLEKISYYEYSKPKDYSVLINTDLYYENLDIDVLQAYYFDTKNIKNYIKDTNGNNFLIDLNKLKR